MGEEGLPLCLSARRDERAAFSAKNISPHIQRDGPKSPEATGKPLVASADAKSPLWEME